MTRNKIKGFTLVELLAVIVILAIILVIAVPKVMDVINDSKKATLESTAKMIASAAEKAKVQNTVLGKTEEITCDSVAKINDLDYEDCDIDFDDNTAKVTIKGSGKFAGLYVCNGTKTDAEATTDSCTSVVIATTFDDDDWSTIVAAVKQAEENGTVYPYNVGDEKTIDLGTTLGTHTIRIANKTKCSAVSVTSQTACGFVLEFKDIITKHYMNPSGEYNGTQYDNGYNLGGWPNTKMRAYLNDLDENDTEDGVIYNALPDDLKEGIIDTYVISSKGSETITGYENVVNGNFYSTDKLYLLSTEEVWAQGDSNTINDDTSRGTSRQLDYYATYEGVDSNGAEYTGVSTTNYGGAIKYSGSTASYWWLRSATSLNSTSFHVVTASGGWSRNDSYRSSGVAPAFRLAN